MRIPELELESKILLAAIGTMVLAVLRLTRLVHFSDSDDFGVLALLAIILANLVVRSRHAAAGTAISFLCFGLLCWESPAAGSPFAMSAHFFLLSFFTIGFVAYGYAALVTYLRPRRKSGPAAGKPVAGMPVRTIER